MKFTIVSDTWGEVHSFHCHDHAAAYVQMMTWILGHPFNFETPEVFTLKY